MVLRKSFIRMKMNGMKKKFRTKFITEYDQAPCVNEIADLTISTIRLDDMEWVNFDSTDLSGSSYDGIFPIKNAKQLEDIGNYFLKLAKKYKNYEVDT